MLNKLKEYKELISIILFFTGGLFWLNNRFPTKTDLTAEITSLNCLVEKYMVLTQLQMSSQDLITQAQELKNDITRIESDSIIQQMPSMKFELEQLREELVFNKKNFRENTAQIDKVMDELARNICTREKK